jgi:hypothetical protein
MGLFNAARIIKNDYWWWLAVLTYTGCRASQKNKKGKGSANT